MYDHHHLNQGTVQSLPPKDAFRGLCGRPCPPMLSSWYPRVCFLACSLFFLYVRNHEAGGLVSGSCAWCDAFWVGPRCCVCQQLAPLVEEQWPTEWILGRLLAHLPGDAHLVCPRLLVVTNKAALNFPCGFV